MSNKEKHYIDKDVLWNEIKLYYDADEEVFKKTGERIIMPDSLGIMILALSENIMTSQNFAGYPYRDQMVGDAYLRIVSILTKRKLKLWSQDNCLAVEKTTFNGWKETTRLKELKIQNPDYIYVATCISNLSSIIDVYKLDNIKYVYHDFENKYHPAIYDKITIADKLYEKSKTDSVEIFKYIYSDYKQDNEKNRISVNIFELNDDKITYTPCMKKNNVFGYLSLIAQREGVNRIKRESKNYNAIHEYQEQEFTRFLSENPEMTPQKIDDDTYEIDFS
jgi:hypothetical protein